MCYVCYTCAMSVCCTPPPHVYVRRTSALENRSAVKPKGRRGYELSCVSRVVSRVEGLLSPLRDRPEWSHISLVDGVELIVSPLLIFS